MGKKKAVEGEVKTRKARKIDVEGLRTLTVKLDGAESELLNGALDAFEAARDAYQKASVKLRKIIAFCR